MKILIVNKSLISNIGLREVISSFVVKKVDFLTHPEDLTSKLEDNSYTHVVISDPQYLATSPAQIFNLAERYGQVKFMLIGLDKFQLFEHMSNTPSNLVYVDEQVNFNTFRKEMEQFLGLSAYGEINGKSDAVLSNGQTKVFEYLISGYRTKQIAERLNIKQNTVSTVKKVIYKKLNAKSVVDLIEYNNSYQVL